MFNKLKHNVKGFVFYAKQDLAVLKELFYQFTTSLLSFLIATLIVIIAFNAFGETVSDATYIIMIVYCLLKFIFIELGYVVKKIELKYPRLYRYNKNP